jgi:hypothetical protein
MDTLTEYSEWCANAVRQYITKKVAETYKGPGEETEGAQGEETEGAQGKGPELQPGFYQNVYISSKGDIRSHTVQIPHIPDV